MMDEFDFNPDPFMEFVAQAMGKVYPSAGAMKWADRLAREHGGEERAMRAMSRAIKDGCEPHEVLKRTEELLEFADARNEMEQDRQKERERAQAIEDRNRRQIAAYREAEQRDPVAPERVAELMGEWKKTDDR
jgi:hypothetical protein